MNLTPQMCTELSSMAAATDEPWEELLLEALSELRTLRNIDIDETSQSGDVAYLCKA